MSHRKSTTGIGTSRRQRHRGRGALLLCSVALLAGGCAERKPRAFPWKTAALVKPIPPAKPANSDVPLDDAPELLVSAPPLPHMPPLRGPARPRVPSNSTSNENNGKSEALDIVPALTTEETAAARGETSQSLNIAARNLERTRGRSLNPTQADLASKVRGFVSDAQQAANAGDWVRAKSLAKKAQVLSEQLAASL